jgi:type VI secretion system protein ImpM
MFGKIPARGDFVSAGLPPGVTRAWDQAISGALAAARNVLADRWDDVWLQAPVWRFAFPETMCGPAPLFGLWMPSVDRAGRHFPLMLAATAPGATTEQMVRHGTAWLDAAEDAGRAAIADDLSPSQLAALIPAPPNLSAEPDADLPHGLCPRPHAGLWWTDGAPLVPAQALVLDTMPDGALLVAMLAGEPPA